MPIAQKQLALPTLIGTANTNLFANPASQISYVIGVVLFNSHTAPVTVTLWNGIPPSGGNVGSPTLAYQVKYTLAAKATLSWIIPQVNCYPNTNRALIASATIDNVITATVCGSIESTAASPLTYSTRLAEPILLGTGTGASTSIVFQNPASQKTFITALSISNTHTAPVTVEIWHLVNPSGGNAGTPVLAEEFLEITLAAGAVFDYYYPFQVCYEDLARSIRARASIANVVNIYAVGAIYV